MNKIQKRYAAAVEKGDLLTISRPETRNSLNFTPPPPPTY